MAAQQRRRTADAPACARAAEPHVRWIAGGGTRAAIICTLVGTPELNGWDPQTYLRALLLSYQDRPHTKSRQSLRMLCVVDDVTREALAIRVARKLSS